MRGGRALAATLGMLGLLAAAPAAQGNAGTLTSQPTVITQNVFDHNTASSAGAVAVLGANPVTLTGNVFTADGASLEGGAVLISGRAQPNTSPVVIALNQFGGATAAQGNASQDIGGAVSLAPGKGQPVSLSGNTFQNNSVVGNATGDREGGAVYVFGSANPGLPVTQSHNTFITNSVTAVQSTPTPARLASGGAEFMLGGAITSVADTFSGNRVATHGGIEPWGGAVGALASVGPPPLAGVFVGTNDLFTGNSTAAGGWGGAIYVGGPPPACTSSCPASSLTLNDSTVVGNSVDPGGRQRGRRDLGLAAGSPGDPQLDRVRQLTEGRGVRVQHRRSLDPVFRRVRGNRRTGRADERAQPLQQPPARLGQPRDSDQSDPRCGIQRPRARGHDHRSRRQRADPSQPRVLPHDASGDRRHGRARVHRSAARAAVPGSDLGGPDRFRTALHHARQNVRQAHLRGPWHVLRGHGDARHRQAVPGR